MTKRQSEILRLWLGGKFWKEIAVELHVSSKTVEWHVRNIYRLIGSSHPARIYKWAMRHGIKP